MRMERRNLRSAISSKTRQARFRRQAGSCETNLGRNLSESKSMATFTGSVRGNELERTDGTAREAVSKIKIKRIQVNDRYFIVTIYNPRTNTISEVLQEQRYNHLI